MKPTKAQQQKLAVDIAEYLCEEDASRHTNCPVCEQDNSQHADDCKLKAYARGRRALAQPAAGTGQKEEAK